MPSRELFILELVAQATPVVKAVLIVLAACSILCWAIILEKAALLFRLRRWAGGFETLAQTPGRGFSDPDPHTNPLAAALLAGGSAEWGRGAAGESAADRRDRIERAMRDAMVSELLRAEARLPYLATIGSAAPFIGLFGTVWGIMHAFTGIAQSNDTSLAVVAPGIAEALFATAIGLVAAIPASIAYNKLAADFGLLARRLSLSIGLLVRRAGDLPADKPAAASP